MLRSGCAVQLHDLDIDGRLKTRFFVLTGRPEHLYHVKEATERHHCTNREPQKELAKGKAEHPFVVVSTRKGAKVVAVKKIEHMWTLDEFDWDEAMRELFKQLKGYFVKEMFDVNGIPQ